MLRNHESSAPIGSGLRAPSPPLRGDRNQGRYAYRQGTMGSDYLATVEFNTRPSRAGITDHDPKRPQPEESGDMEDSDEEISASQTDRSRRGGSRISGGNHGANMGDLNAWGAFETEGQSSDF